MLSAEAIRAQLGERGTWPEIRVLGSVTSTSDIAWAWAEAGCPEGMVVLAEEQVWGRGRFGRTWYCPRGRGVLMSLVLRPPSESISPAHLTALGAIAVADAIDDVAGLPTAIRWPNDVTIRGRKVAGVLVERRASSGPAPCVLGVGLNVNIPRSEFPEEFRDMATSLEAEAGHAFEIESVAAALLGRLSASYRHALEGRWADVALAWRRRCSLLGETIEAEANGHVYRGRVVAVDPVEGVELELAGGQRLVCRAESASLRTPRPTEPEARA